MSRRKKAENHGAGHQGASRAAIAFGLGALIIAFTLYRPALSGPFVFDDLGLPFYLPSFAQHPIGAWLSGVRPVLMLSYWLNYQVSARDPWTYHVINVLVHVMNSVLVFIFLSRILRLQGAGVRQSLTWPAVASCIFLVHPIQTEAVAYIAGRSELICGFFILAALAVYSNPALTALSWRSAALLLFLYCAAVLSKEQAAVLPAIFLVIDIVFRRLRLRQALWRGARLYVPVAAVGAFAVIGVFAVLAQSSSAGFNVRGMQWYEYLFTQFRVWPLYLMLAVLPFRQNADYDIPLSHHPGEHGSAAALAVLLAGAFAVWRMRERFPLLFGGALIFAILLAPTSTFVPIQDLAAERRMYLPLAGLLLVLIQVLLWRPKASETVTAGLAAYLLTCCALTYERTKVWSSDIAFWSDTVSQSPGKARGYTHLTYAYVRAQRCPEAVETAQRAPEWIKRTPDFLGMLGHAYACDQKITDAVNAFERAVQAAPTVGSYLALASAYRRAGRTQDADAAEQQGLKLQPRTPFDLTMVDALRAREQSRSRAAPAGAMREAE
jgi:protein O-mannosyl-transferase